MLLRSAPHIMWPLRFVMPHDPAMRPAWMIRTGLFLYDHLARREVLPGSQQRRPAPPRGRPAAQAACSRRGFVYSDGWVDDARLVVLNAHRRARSAAPQVLTRWRCVERRRGDTGWTVDLDNAAGERRTVRARALVNAAGPWAAQFLREAPRAHGEALDRRCGSVKGSHIVVPKLFDHDHAYIFQNPDKRIIFAIPYEERLHADRHHRRRAPTARSARRASTSSEIAYLCEQAQPLLRASR